MRGHLRLLLIATLLAFASASAAELVTYGYYGTITSSSGYAGVNAGDPVSITVTYDPAAGPDGFAILNAPHYVLISSGNGDGYGKPWATWMSVTATFGGHIWQNDLASGWVNVAQRSVHDNDPSGSTYGDRYQPFVVVQTAVDNLGVQNGRRYAYWTIERVDFTPPTLTNGLVYPQPIDFSRGVQHGELHSVDPEMVDRRVFFALNQGSIDVPISPVLDTTPPVITPTITGTLGLNGWYTGAVTVAWSVIDDDSDVISPTGCEATSLTNDTTGIALTCSATSEGGTSSSTVTIKIDATPPTLTGSASPAPNTAGWNNAPVLVTVYCTDNANGSGVSSSSNFAGGTLASDGANQSFPSTGHCYDNAGNEASPATVTVSGIKIDRTAPTFGACTGGPFLYGSGLQPVIITANDALSGMDLPGSTLSGSVNANVLGSASLLYTAKDIAGNSSAKPCTYQVISITFALTVSKSGNGTGTVTSTPTGINCGATCATNFDSGTAVTLTPVAAVGSVFAGWSGACNGTGACVVTVDALKSVGAVFNLQTFALTVIKSGTGTGTVTSTPAGINCGATCYSSFNDGTSVTLTPAPDKASSFAGWGGACSGKGACVVSMNDAKTVSATFKKGTSSGRK